MERSYSLGEFARQNNLGVTTFVARSKQAVSWLAKLAGEQ